MSSKTNAERQRRYREKIKNTPKGEEYKESARERSRRNRKSVNEVSETEKKRMRARWRKDSRKKSKPAEKDKKSENPQAMSMMNRIKRLQNEVNILKEQNTKNSRKAEKYRKRLTRKNCEEKNQLSKTPDVNLSPKSKTQKQLSTLSNVEKNKLLPKLLLIQNSITESLKMKYKEIRKRSAKKNLKDVMISKTLQKYRLVRAMARVTGLNLRIKKKKTGEVEDAAEKIDNERRINEFYNRDDVSRATAGKKEVISKKKKKYQLRFLQDKLTNLHAKFNQENPNNTVGLATFARYRPDYVKRPAVEKRETCMCKAHANFSEKIKKLHKLKQLGTSDYNEVIKESMCNFENMSCAYNICPVCKNKGIQLMAVENENEDITYEEWVNVTEERIKKTKTGQKSFKVTFVKKELKKASIKGLKEEVNKELLMMKKHLFNIYNQQRCYQILKEELEDNEAIIHCDFSENYNCKLSEEIQSYHFGAARNQVSLHTSVIYIKGQDPISVCTVSPNLQHDPEAIWAHLTPLINQIKTVFEEQNRRLDVLHFFSDGPCTQYRQKLNFYLFKKKILDFKIKHGTWSFFESGHGKGSADGIGAVIKRAGDDLVAKQVDIPDAKTLYDKLKDNLKVKLFYIESEDIEVIRNETPNDLVPIKGNNTIHQLYTNGNVLKFRELSCYCRKNQFHGSEAKLCDCTSFFKIGNLIRTIDEPKQAKIITKGKRKAVEPEKDYGKKNETEDFLPEKKQKKKE